MRARRPSLFLFFVAVSVLAAATARAEMPEAGERERQWDLARAYERFEAGRFEQALAGFEAAAREPAPPLPAEALRRWGVAASEAGWPLAAYLRLRQYVAVEPEAVDREALGQRIARAREALLETAVRDSRLIALAETRPSWDLPGEHQVVRLVGRNGRATVEALAGPRVASPTWERAGEIGQEEYMALVARLLDATAWLEDWPRQEWDPNDAGPRRAVVLRLVVGEEEHARQALRGAPYHTLRGLAGMVMEFARAAPAKP
jgi:tetratricopeptide (TPR) repeat protein